MANCRSRVVYSSPKDQTLCAVPIRLTRCIEDITRGLHIWTADGGDCREFFERDPLPNEGAPSLIMRTTTEARWYWFIFAHFMI